ncbi:hypothetical protein BD289DRAFT_447887 [Coniella lustricola]|uniref:Secreted protein n=1 Tax=Coniella lustricola TaxID=2025994 RepID=A0A2T2ZSN1_9PEZI|nr:hypothetical protein BD289DRAFT_447887 [Coniella lustricola]
MMMMLLLLLLPAWDARFSQHVHAWLWHLLDHARVVWLVSVCYCVYYLAERDMVASAQFLAHSLALRRSEDHTVIKCRVVSCRFVFTDTSNTNDNDQGE